MALDDLRGVGLLSGDMTLYHGSATPGIKQFEVAEETTLGRGVYFTSQRDKAEGYAKKRAGGDKVDTPILYEASISGLNLADLRTPENMDIVMPGLVGVLEEAKGRKMQGVAEISWPALMQDLIEEIERKAYRIGLKIVTRGAGRLFSDYLKDHGFDGLIAEEGGEHGWFKGERIDIGNHDTYVIFEPGNVQVVREIPID